MGRVEAPTKKNKLRKPKKEDIGTNPDDVTVDYAFNQIYTPDGQSRPLTMQNLVQALWGQSNKSSS